MIPEVDVRVRITGEHPWSGHEGSIVGEFHAHPQLDWVVELDDGHQCAVSKDEVVLLDVQRP